MVDVDHRLQYDCDTAMSDTILNCFPRLPQGSRRIAIVGEAPSGEDVKQGLPFAGAGGRFLWDSLKEVGITREECFVGNVCQHQAPHDKIKLLKWSDSRIQDGIAALTHDLKEFDPTFIIAMGNLPLRALVGEPRGIDAWKNTLAYTHLTGKPVKTLFTYHPSAVLHDDTRRFFWHFQMERAGQEANTGVLDLFKRDIHVHTNPTDAVEALRSLHGKRLAFDLEGYAKSGATSFALSPSAHIAHVFPFRRINHSAVYGEHEETIWQEFASLVDSFDLYEPWHEPTARWLELIDSGKTVNSLTSPIPNAPPVGLVTHNGLYDAFVLSYSGRKPIHHAIVDDTMVLWWELFSEVDKSLADLVSVLTREPHYKHERKNKDDMVAWTYNGKDTCVTFECCDALYKQPTLTPAAYAHYGFNMSLILPILYMELRGIRFDDTRRQQLLAKIQQRIYVLQDALNTKTGMPLVKTPAALIEHLRTLCVKSPRRYTLVPWQPKSGPRKGETLTKKIATPVEIQTLSDVREFARSEHRKAVAGLSRMLGNDGARLPTLGCADRGLLSMRLKLHFNINSPSANDFLYGDSGLAMPPIYKIEEGRKTDRLTHDSDALLTCYLRAQKQPRYAKALPVLKCWLKLASLITATETLSKPADIDGRMRCSYNHVGPGTGRFSCSQSAAKIGYNLQTVTKSHRYLFIADPSCLIGQHDLEGADGWTVAAFCASLGDLTMLEDYKAKLKPARVATLITDHGAEVNYWDREKIRQLAKLLPDDWRYLAMKRVAWGTCYLMGLVKMCEQILGDSYAKGGVLTYVPVDACKMIQGAFLTRYWGITKWQDATAEQVLREGYVETCVGHRRYFYGKRWEWKENFDGTRRAVINRTIHGAALADLPQEHTTLATKIALWRLYYSNANRAGNQTTTFAGFPSFTVEPLHTVHDSLVTQFRETDKTWAAAFIHQCFQNKLYIAGHEITIPVAGECSTDWGMKKAEKL